MLTRERTLALMEEHAQLEITIQNATQEASSAKARQKEIIELLRGGEGNGKPMLRQPRPKSEGTGPSFKRRNGVVGVPEQVWTFFVNPVNVGQSFTAGQVARNLDIAPPEPVAIACNKFRAQGFLKHDQNGYSLAKTQSPAVADAPADPAPATPEG